MKRENCIFYAQNKRTEYCKALKELYCTREDCKFYKADNAYYLDGTRRAGRTDANS